MIESARLMFRPVFARAAFLDPRNSDRVDEQDLERRVSTV